MKKYAKHQNVRWRWRAKTTQGRVLAHYESRVTKKLQGKAIVRRGSAQNPAYLIAQANGRQVLKLHSELLGQP